MKKFTPHIVIWKLELFDEEFEIPDYYYFLTRRGVKRFLRIHKEEIDKRKFRVSWGGEPLWLW